MNAINFSGFNPNAAWFSARRVVGVVPAGRTRDVVASAYSILWLCFRRAQVRRHDLSRVVANAVDDELFDAAQARSAATGVAFVAPRVGFAGDGRLNFDLVVVESVAIAGAIGVVVAAVSVGARLHEASLVVVRRFYRVAFVVVDGGDDFRELQEDFALVLSYAKTLAARHTAWTPITGDEPARIEFKLERLGKLKWLGIQ